MKLNHKYRKILYELSRDARQPASRIARKVGVSKDVAAYALKRLIKRKVITRNIALIDTERLGFTRYELYISLKGMEQEREKELISFLSEHPMFLWVRESLGDWDVLTEFYARDVYEYERTIRAVTNQYSSIIRSMDSAAVLKEHSFPLKCIGYCKEGLAGSNEKERGSPAELDRQDYAILKMLSKNARTSVVEIASHTVLSPDAVIYRMKNLKKTGIIQGYSVTVDEKMLGLSKYKLLLKLNAIRSAESSRLLTLLKMHNSTQYIKICAGSWDLSITLLVRDMEELRQIIISIKKNLKDSLSCYKVIILYEEHKNTYFPDGVAAKC